jgi:hypothetical protein
MRLSRNQAGKFAFPGKNGSLLLVSLVIFRIFSNYVNNFLNINMLLHQTLLSLMKEVLPDGPG